MKKIMNKIRWNNVVKTILFVVCLYVVLSDVYFILISPIFTNKLLSWTYLGFVSFGLSLYYMIWFVEEFKKEK